MRKDKKLVQIAADDRENYSIRKQALDDIKDKHFIDYLAENAKDEWIRLESAIQNKNTRILEQLTNHPDERIRLDAAIELGNQEALAGIVINSDLALHRDIALNYITSKIQLRHIVERSSRDQDRVEAAIRLGDNEICRSLISEITNEDLLFRIAQFINDYKLLAEISGKATNARVKKITSEWLEDLTPGTGREID